MKTRITLACVATFAFFGMIQLTQAATLPTVTSANLTYRLDASFGVTSGGSGTPITAWTEQVSGASVNVQSTPTFQAAGLNGRASVRFDGGAAGGDLIFSNNGAAIQNTLAQTIFVVATMASDGFVLSDLIANSSGAEAIRQTTSETAAYFTGNASDFHSGGSFFVNGVSQFTIPGGFDAPHIVESVSSAQVNIFSLRIGDNAANRLWAGDVSEVLVYDGILSADDRGAVYTYLNAKYFSAPEPSTLVLGALGIIGLMAGGRRRNRG